MADHPLRQIADIVHAQGGEGMEMRTRPLGRGALLRVWVPDPRSVAMIGMVCSRHGLRDVQFMRHVTDGGAHDGSVQMTIGIPEAMVADFQAAMKQAALPAGPVELDAMIELGPGDG
ncbi:MAG TPA: hypothetical protein VMX12_07540 [Acidimicrobiia bacterium]|nr:hypothetical protein [Acidimicrobiia bacterium]